MKLFFILYISKKIFYIYKMIFYKTDCYRECCQNPWQLINLKIQNKFLNKMMCQNCITKELRFTLNCYKYQVYIYKSKY